MPVVILYIVPHTDDLFTEIVMISRSGCSQDGVLEQVWMGKWVFYKPSELLLWYSLVQEPLT